MGAGRQRTFDKEDALNKAMEVFWLKGFNGTSLSDLTEIMGINRPSLYAAFGNKESLFISAIEQYANKYGAPHFGKLLNSEARLPERIRIYLESITKMATDPTLPGGCFITASTSEAGSNCLPKDAVQTVMKINADSLKTLVEFFKNEKKKGNIASKESPEVLANHLLTIQFGLAVMARNRATQSSIMKTISRAVTSF